jgi:nucleoid-associated protein YgaU
MTASGRRIVVPGSVAAGLLLLLVAPTPAAALHALREPAATADVTGPLVALLSLIAWALAAWLLLTAALTAGAHLPGTAGRASRSAARRLAPAAVRRGIELALGLSVVVGVVGSAPAAANPRPPAGPALAAVSLDWSAPDPDAPAPPLDWAASPTAAPSPAAPDDVVVSPGDSLWRIAEQDLAARSGIPPSDAAVAQAWPSWWAANRDAVGEDPDLISPGTRLRPPEPDSSPDRPS